MSTSESDDQSCIFVHATRAPAVDVLSQNVSVVRLLAVLATGIIGSKVYFNSNLVTRLELTQFNTFLFVGVCSAAMYLILFPLIKLGLSKLIAYVVPPIEETEAVTVRSWLLSESAILRQFDGWSQTLSATAVKSVVEEDHWITLTFKSLRQDRLNLSDFSSKEDFEDAKKLLTDAMAIDKWVTQSPEKVEGELLASGSYTKREQAVMRRFPSMERGSCKRRWNVGVCTALAIGAEMLLSDFFLESGISVKSIANATLFSAVLIGPTCVELYASRFAERGREFRWGVSPAGLSFSTLHQNYYQTNSLRWENLTEATEMEEGLLLSFQRPEFSTLIPRRTVSLTEWDELLKRVQQYRV